MVAIYKKVETTSGTLCPLFGDTFGSFRLGVLLVSAPTTTKRHIKMCKICVPRRQFSVSRPRIEIRRANKRQFGWIRSNNGQRPLRSGEARKDVFAGRPFYHRLLRQSLTFRTIFLNHNFKFIKSVTKIVNTWQICLHSNWISVGIEWDFSVNSRLNKSITIQTVKQNCITEKMEVSLNFAASLFDFFRVFFLFLFFIFCLLSLFLFFFTFIFLFQFNRNDTKAKQSKHAITAIGINHWNTRKEL